jgi:valyl-tRNA synthetase
MADSSATPTTKNALRREAKRLEKEAKVAAKSLNTAASGFVGAVDKKVKEKKEKEKEDYDVDDTPKGEKKGLGNVPPHVELIDDFG